MCQLLGLNANKAVSLAFSLEGFVRRGGDTDHHGDGWGFGFFEGERCRLISDPRPAARSPAMDWLRHHPVRARNAIAHIRKATRGEVALENCHPFQRPLWGRTWLFAHNGHLEHTDFAFGTARPHGQTDSERAFCHLLHRLGTGFGAHMPPLPELLAALREISADIARHGVFNYLLSNGDWLVAHCATELHHVRREAPFARARLLDCELGIDFARHNHLDDCISLIATRPLTADEAWTAFAPGELKLFIAGRESRDGLAPPLRLAV